MRTSRQDNKSTLCCVYTFSSLRCLSLTLCSVTDLPLIGPDQLAKGSVLFIFKDKPTHTFAFCHIENKPSEFFCLSPSLITKFRCVIFNRQAPCRFSVYEVLCTHSHHSGQILPVHTAFIPHMFLERGGNSSLSQAGSSSPHMFKFDKL